MTNDSPIRFMIYFETRITVDFNLRVCDDWRLFNDIPLSSAGLCMYRYWCISHHTKINSKTSFIISHVMPVDLETTISHNPHCQYRVDVHVWSSQYAV